MMTVHNTDTLASRPMHTSVNSRTARFMRNARLVKEQCTARYRKIERAHVHVLHPAAAHPLRPPRSAHTDTARPEQPVNSVTAGTSPAVNLLTSSRSPSDPRFPSA